MARKIMSFYPSAGSEYKLPANKDLTKLDSWEEIAQHEKLVYISFDDEYLTPVENDEIYMQKVYDFDNEEDVKAIQRLFNGSTDISRKLQEIELREIHSTSLYQLLIGIINQDKKIIDKILGIEKKQDEFLKGLGFPGTSILP